MAAGVFDPGAKKTGAATVTAPGIGGSPGPEYGKANLLRCRWRGRRRTAGAVVGSGAAFAAMAPLRAQLLPLGFLFRSQEAAELLAFFAADLLHLLAALFRCERGVLAERPHLRSVFEEECADLRLLVGGEIELLGHHLEPLLGIHAAGAAFRPALVRGRRRGRRRRRSIVRQGNEGAEAEDRGGERAADEIASE